MFLYCSEFMDENPNIECRGAAHNKIIGGITVTGIILWSLFVPISIFRFTSKRRNLLEKRQAYIEFSKKEKKKTPSSIKQDNEGKKARNSQSSLMFFFTKRKGLFCLIKIFKCCLLFKKK